MADWRLKLISGDANPRLAEGIAAELELPVELDAAGVFADGESHVHISGDVRGADVVLIQPTSPPVNDRLVNLALLADAARAAGAARVIAVVPYFGYARQERRAGVGDPRSAQIVARLLQSAGIDHLITLDLHVPALESALPMPATLLQPDGLFLPVLRDWKIADLTIVSPDAGGMKRAQRFAAALNAELAVVAKIRSRADVAEPVRVLGEVRGRTCVIVDDMASTGRTLAGAAEALRQAGADLVHAVFTHPVMAGGALDRIAAAPIERLLTCDSIPVPHHPRLQVATTAPLLADAIRTVVSR